MASTWRISWFLLLLVVQCGATSGESPRRRRLRSGAWGYPGFNATFDYIIVGGGTTGLAIAARLALESSSSVAVIEAGGFHDQDNSNSSVVPFYSLTGMPFIDPTPNFPPQPLFEWGRVTVPMPGAAGRRIHYAQAKTLGGCSAHNTMAYLRTTKGAHKKWAEIAGDDTYKFDRMLRYFKKSVTLTPPNWKKRNTPNATFPYDSSVFAEGKGGPVQVSWGNWVDSSITWFAKAFQAVGLPLSPVGLSSGTLSGSGSFVPSTINPNTAERSTARAYLDEILESTEIIVYHHTQALKVNFDARKKATSVLVSTLGQIEFTLSARKEIIISAGVFHSPQLLMVSGVGPAAALTSQKIPVIADLPGVGQNLLDQITLSVSAPIGNIPTAAGYVSSPDAAVQASILRQYLDDQAGPLSSIGSYLVFEKLPSDLRRNFSSANKQLLSSLPADFPDVEYVVAGAPDTTDRTQTIGTIAAVLLNPFSKGSVSVSSPRMQDPPVIDLGWLTHPADTEVVVAAFKRLRQFFDSPVLASLNRSGNETAPGRDAVKTDEEILQHIRQTTMQIWHASSTCSMGTDPARGAVVDGQGRVFGVKGLRVADMSVVPFNPPTHPQGTLYALGEKIADDIIRGR